MARLEAKIDHLERSLVHNKPSTSRVASTIGRTLGNLVNQGDIGAFAGEGLAKLFGHGDYSVKSNSLMKGNNSGTSIPKFSKDRRGTRVTEREFIMDISSGALVSGSSDFFNTSFGIVPTNRATFPWLSTIANQFDQWEPHGIVFEFISSSSEFNGVSQALGTVILASDYDVTDSAYASKQVMENSDYSCSTRPSNNLVHGIECDPKERPIKLMYTSEPESNDARFNTLANFQVASVGCSTANVKLGELWISYDITFYKKQLVSFLTGNFLFEVQVNPVVGQPFLSTPIIIQNRLNFSLVNVAGVGTNVFLPPTMGQGRYVLLYHTNLVNVGDVVTIVATSATTNTTIVRTLQAMNPTVNGILACVFDINRPGAFVSFNGLKFVATQTALLTITEVPPDFNF